DPASAKWNPACGAPPPYPEEGYRINSESTCYATPPNPSNSYTYQSWTWRGSHNLIRTHRQIPLELYSGPIFFTHGSDDQLWCVSKAEGMKLRLEDADRKPEVHIFPGEGHSFGNDAEMERKELLLEFLKQKLG
ncbi:MAG: prolyl oligopeptidase family serine peptidase, partial [Bdellovibrionales bacterium]|nr:prolyl oligopeptidase family serine peptidase [Bdellovibrionales bacterium]